MAERLSQPDTDQAGKRWPALAVKLMDITGTKLERLGRVEHVLSGVVPLLLLPTYPPATLPLSAWIGELTGFTGREHEINDRVDVLTLALEWWRSHGQPLRFIGGEQRASAAFR